MNSLLAAYRDLDPRAAANLESADRASRLLFGIGLNELLFDWIGPDVAVFGLEGRPKPVFALQIADEGARKRAFDRLLSSVAVTGDDSTVLDGYRITSYNVCYTKLLRSAPSGGRALPVLSTQPG